jgi:nucleotide-binding universal stress UspA family protein
MRCRKILIGLPEGTFQTQEIDFAGKYLVGENSLVVGTFLTDLVGDARPKLRENVTEKGTPAAKSRKTPSSRTQLATYLREQGKLKGYKTIVRREQGSTLLELLQESRYADLLVISQQSWRAEASFPLRQPVSQLLAQCECPVLVIPNEPEAFEQVVLTYDGTKEAMKGIKQFLYLLPELAKNLPLTVLATYFEGSEPTALEEKLFIEYLKQHFTGVGMHRLCENSEHTLISTIGLNERTLVIINNPSPMELSLLHALLYPDKALPAPLELYTQGTVNPSIEKVND